MINQVQLAHEVAVEQVERQRQRDIVTARKYHDGLQIVPLTDRMRKVLGVGLDAENDLLFRLNVTKAVVTAAAERLIVSGFDCADTKQLAWLNRVFVENKMDGHQSDVHEDSLRDGESFVMVDWDTEAQLPRMTTFERYTAVEVEGSGNGCYMIYPSDDPSLKARAAVKIWTDRNDANEFIQYKNVYYPDHIEHWEMDARGQWKRTRVDPWVSRDGKPLGIALIPFNNKRTRCEAWDAWPLQNAINKMFVDLIQTGDLTAFRIFVALGFIPTTDGKAPAEDRSNWLDIEPGQIVGTTESDADFKAIDAADLKPMVDVLEQLILWLAMATDTPVNRFISTRQIASDKTLKEQEGPLLAKIRNRQITYGSAWVDCMKLARRIWNTFGPPGEELDEEVQITVQWAEAQPSAQKDRLELLKLKGEMGVPREQLWKEMGYTQEAIEAMKLMVQKEAQDGQNSAGPDSGSGSRSGSGGRSGSGRPDAGAGQSEDDSAAESEDA